MFWRLLLGLMFLFAAANAEARDLYVNNASGSDESTGLSRNGVGAGGPVRTIGRALRLALPGDRIFIAKTTEPYREQISISGPCLHGSPRRPLVISSDGAVLDGTVVAATGAWKHLAGDVFAMRPRRLTYQQMFRGGRPLERVRLASHYDAAEVLEPLQWSLVHGAILFRPEEDRLPSSYELRHAGMQTGITLYNTHDVVIEGLVIQGFQQDGVNAHELVKSCVLRNLECRANGRSGLSVGGVSRVKAEGCNVYDNGRVQVRSEGLARLAMLACDVDKDSETPAFQINGGEITADGKPALGVR